MTSPTLKRTPLFETHRDAGAKLVPFAGWEMPVQYADGIRAEHVAVRTAAGIFDVSHMGEVEISGPDAEAFLQRMYSNDVTKMAIGGAQYALLCAEDGGVLDDLFTYRLGPDRYLTVTNAANHDVGLRLARARTPRASTSRSPTRADRYAMLAVQGPIAREIVQAIADAPLPARMTAPARDRRRPRRAHLRHRLHRRGRRRAARSIPTTRRPCGTRSCAAAPSPPGSPRATRCASRPAFTSTATTSRPIATRSRPASAGPARRPRASSAREAVAAARAAGPRREARRRSSSPAPASRARATRSSAAAR